MASTATERAFATSPCGARTTIKEIILNLNVMGEEGRKKMVLASSRKREDILYTPHFDIYCVFILIKKTICVMYFFLFSFFFFSLFQFVRLVCRGKIIKNVAINNHILLLLHNEKKSM